MESTTAVGVAYLAIDQDLLQKLDRETPTQLADSNVGTPVIRCGSLHTVFFFVRFWQTISHEKTASKYGL